MLRSCIRLGLVALVGAVAVTAHADERRFRANDIRTLFAIAKNTNRNEVQYGVKLDDECQPVGNEPVYAYWRDFEKGPEVTDDLSAIERSLYGVREQRVLARAPGESKILMSLKATPQRGIAIFVRKRDGKCVSESIATINGAPARLERIFVHVAGLMSVDWVELRGQLNGQPAIERVKH